MDSTYAPQSPDLSSFLSSPSKSQQPYQQHQPTPQSASYAPRSPVIPSFNTQPHHTLHHQQYNQHANQQPSFGLGLGGGEFGEYGSASYMPPIPALPPQHSFGAPSASPYFQQQVKDEHEHEYKPSFDGADGESDYIPSPTMSTSATRRGRPPASSHTAVIPSTSSFQQTPSQQSLKNPNPNNIEIKTKFPVARIKRIMQADEEVGKVAQVTPVAVSKALELFMIALVEGAAGKAREKGGKRVTAQHLKAVVEGDEQFDFLSEIVGKVADVQEGAGAAKRKDKVEVSESEEEKKHKKGKGRRKKSDD